MSRNKIKDNTRFKILYLANNKEIVKIYFKLLLLRNKIKDNTRFKFIVKNVKN